MMDGGWVNERLTAAIFDVDGVLLGSPHEQAWREALTGLADPARFTTAMYQAAVAGKPRMDGALAALVALVALGVPDAAAKAGAYGACKQAKLEALIAAGHVTAFPDALRFVAAVSALGWPMALASSSKNANAMLQQIRLPDGRELLPLFSAPSAGATCGTASPTPRSSRSP